MMGYSFLVIICTYLVGAVNYAGSQSVVSCSKHTIFQTSIHAFVTIDQIQFNPSPYVFVNANPIHFVDLDGNMPIQISPYLPEQDAIRLMNMAQKLTDDIVGLHYNSLDDNLEFSIERVVDSEILRPSGTHLLRDLENIPGQYVLLDFDNSLGTANPMSMASNYPNRHADKLLLKPKYGTCIENDRFNVFEYSASTIVNIQSSYYQDRGMRNVLTREGDLISLPFQAAYPEEIVFGHELIHAHRHAFQKIFFKTVDGGRSRRFSHMLVSDQRAPLPGHSFQERISWEEIRTIGLSYESPRNHALQGIDLTGSHSENLLRHENNLPYRISYGNFTP